MYTGSEGTIQFRKIGPIWLGYSGSSKQSDQNGLLAYETSARDAVSMETVTQSLHSHLRASLLRARQRREEVCMYVFYVFYVCILCIYSMYVFYDCK